VLVGVDVGVRSGRPGTSISGARGRGRSCRGWGAEDAPARVNCGGAGAATSAAAQIRAANRRCRGSGVLGVAAA
jgi:hypothetical protein